MATLEDLNRRVTALENESVKTQLDRIENTLNSRLGHAASLTVFDALEDLKERLERIEGKLP